jgi:hypothetical protein
MREQDSESTNSQRGGAIIVHCCIVADKKKIGQVLLRNLVKIELSKPGLL